MNAIFGLLEALESAILESPKIPFTNKTIVEENKVLELIDKIRLVLKGGDDLIQDSISKKIVRENNLENSSLVVEEKPKSEKLTAIELKKKAEDIIHDAEEKAREIKFQADKYADEVLANVALVASRIIRSVESGRQRLSQLAERDKENKND